MTDDIEPPQFARAASAVWVLAAILFLPLATEVAAWSKTLYLEPRYWVGHGQDLDFVMTFGGMTLGCVTLSFTSSVRAGRQWAILLILGEAFLLILLLTLIVVGLGFTVHDRLTFFSSQGRYNVAQAIISEAGCVCLLLAVIGCAGRLWRASADSRWTDLRGFDVEFPRAVLPMDAGSKAD